MSFISVIFAITVTIWDSQALAAPIATRKPAQAVQCHEQIYNGPVPEYLFHWTSPESLVATAASRANPALVPLKEIGHSTFASIWGHFRNTKGLFTWTHPAGAISAERERYASLGADGKPPRLLVLKPIRNAKVVEVFTNIGASVGTGISSSTLQRADLVFHHVVSGSGRPKFSEWIVLNPESIAEFSADPAALPSHIRAQLIKARNNPGLLAETDLFYPRYPDLEYRHEMVASYLEGGKEGIPPSLLRSLSLNEGLRLQECLAQRIQFYSAQ